MTVEGCLTKIEARFDKWLADFEEKPISTGLRVVVIVLILRWIWKSFR